MRRIISLSMGILLLLAGMFGFAHTMTLDSVGSGPLPDGKNNTVYIHSTGGSSFWSNALKTDPESAQFYISSSTTVLERWVYNQFPLRMGPSNDSALAKPITFVAGKVTGQAKVSISYVGPLSPPDVIYFGIGIYDQGGQNTDQGKGVEVPYQTSGIYTFEFSWPEITVQQGYQISLCVNYQIRAGDTTATITTDGSSFMVVPIKPETTGGGGGGGGGGSGNNNNTTNGNGDDMSLALMILVPIIVLILVVAIFLMTRKPKHKEASMLIKKGGPKKKTLDKKSEKNK